MTGLSIDAPNVPDLTVHLCPLPLIVMGFLIDTDSSIDLCNIIVSSTDASFNASDKVFVRCMGFSPPT